MSLIGGFFGTSMIITSGENIGIVRATNVRSRYVTATAGVILILIALFAPLGRLANAIPSAVVGGTAMVVFAIIGTMGIDMLRKVDLHERGNMFVLAGALTMGLLPILVPGLYSKFPETLQLVLGNGLAMGSITAIVLNIVFHHFWPCRDRTTDPAPCPVLLCHTRDQTATPCPLTLIPRHLRRDELLLVPELPHAA